MSKTRHPNRGSLQYWPRKRFKHRLARIRSWSAENKAKPLGFIGYKVGMTHLHITDQRPKSLTKGEKINWPSTIVECPPMTVLGVVFYRRAMRGSNKSTLILSDKFHKHLKKSISVPKKPEKKFDDVKEFSDVRLLVHSNPSKTGIGTKKPQLLEIALGGKKEEKLAYAKEVLGKDISIEDVFAAGNPVDIHGITKGKGFQGTVKRYGVPIRQHKSEKVKRGIGNLGAWTPKRVQFQVPQPGKMGFHLRTEYNKPILKIGAEAVEIQPKSGFHKYGVVKNPFILLHGSIVGPRKRAVVLTQAARPTRGTLREAPHINKIAR
jgi:large subunit ribosomal protein L3